MSLGDYSKTTYANNGTPAINATNLNNNESKLKEIDTALGGGGGITSGATFTNTTQSISANSTWDLDISLPIKANTGHLILRSVGNGSSCAVIYFDKTAANAWALNGGSAAAYDYGTLGYCTGNMFGPSNLYIKVQYAVIVAGTPNILRIRFENTDSSARVISMRGYYQVSL